MVRKRTNNTCMGPIYLAIKNTVQFTFNIDTKSTIPTETYYSTTNCFANSVAKTIDHATNIAYSAAIHHTPDQILQTRPNSVFIHSKTLFMFLVFMARQRPLLNALTPSPPT